MPTVDVGVFYDFGGLRIHSAFDLPWLVALADEQLHERSADLQISLSTASPPVGRPVCSWAGHYRLSLEACGDAWLIRHTDSTGFIVTDAGRTVRCHCPDLTNLPLLAEIIVRRVLPRLSVLLGRLPIHAATLGDGAGAVMLLGSSGAGKSTMTAALALHLGWDIFSDDMSLLSDSGRFLAHPSMPGVSLWETSQRALGVPLADCRPLQSRKGKVWYSPQTRRPLQPAPLEAVVLLSIASDTGGISCTRLSGPEVVVGLFSQLVVFNRVDTVQLRVLMARFAKIAATVPIYGLAYPRDFAALPDVVETIRQIRAGAIS